MKRTDFIKETQNNEVIQLQLKIKQVDSQYVDLRKKYNDLKHQRDSFFLKLSDLQKKQYQEGILTQKTSIQMSKLDRQNIKLRQVLDNQLTVIQSYKERIQNFLINIPKHIPNQSLQQVLQYIHKQNKRQKQKQMLQERIKSMERKIQKSIKQQHQIKQVDQQLKKQLREAQQKKAILAKKLDQMKYAFIQTNNQIQKLRQSNKILKQAIQKDQYKQLSNQTQIYKIQKQQALKILQRLVNAIQNQNITPYLNKLFGGYAYKCQLLKQKLQIQTQLQQYQRQYHLKIRLNQKQEELINVRKNIQHMRNQIQKIAKKLCNFDFIEGIQQQGILQCQQIKSIAKKDQRLRQHCIDLQKNLIMAKTQLAQTGLGYAKTFKILQPVQNISSDILQKDRQTINKVYLQTRLQMIKKIKQKKTKILYTHCKQ